MGNIVFLDQHKANILRELGFPYVTHKMSQEQETYWFTASDELIKIVSGNFAKNEYFTSEVTYL